MFLAVWLALSPQVFEANRKTWIRVFRYAQPVFEGLLHAPPGEVYLIEGWKPGWFRDRYAAMPFAVGRGFRHTVRGGTLQELTAALDRGEPAPAYVAVVAHKRARLPENIGELVAALASYGYRVTGKNHASLLLRQPRDRERP